MVDRRTQADREVEVFRALIKKQPDFLNLPLEELIPLSFIGEAAVAAHRKIVRRIKDLKLADDQVRAIKDDADDAAEALIDIRVRRGELLPPVEETSSRTGIIRDNSGKAVGSDHGLPDGITPADAYADRQLKDNPDVVIEMKKEARESHDQLVTTSKVLTRIRNKKRVAATKEVAERSASDVDEAVSAVIDDMGDCLAELKRLWPERERISEDNRRVVYALASELFALVKEEDAS